MTGKFFCLLFWGCLILTQPACAEEPTVSRQGLVTWVYDGDTLQVQTFGKVRLIGIDTPEREASPRDQFLLDKGVTLARQREIYRTAKEFNINLVKGKEVTLVIGEPSRDRHGRLLAYVYLPDGRLLNRLLVERGLAVVYRRFEFRMKGDFLAAEALARQHAEGLWAQLE